MSLRLLSHRAATMVAIHCQTVHPHRLQLQLPFSLEVKTCLNGWPIITIQQQLQVIMPQRMNRGCCQCLTTITILPFQGLQTQVIAMHILLLTDTAIPATSTMAIPIIQHHLTTIIQIHTMHHHHPHRITVSNNHNHTNLYRPTFKYPPPTHPHGQTFFPKIITAPNKATTTINTNTIHMVHQPRNAKSCH